MSKVLVIIVALFALLGVVYVGGKAANHSAMNQQSMMNYTVSPTGMTQGDQSDNAIDTQDDASLNQVAADDNADLSDTSGL